MSPKIKGKIRQGSFGHTEGLGFRLPKTLVTRMLEVPPTAQQSSFHDSLRTGCVLRGFQCTGASQPNRCHFNCSGFGGLALRLKSCKGSDRTSKVEVVRL